MTDTPNLPAPAQVPALPPMITGISDRLVHQAAGAVVTLMIAHGLVEKTQSAQAVDLLSSILVAAAGIGIAWLQARLQRRRVAAALNAPAPAVPVKP